MGRDGGNAGRFRATPRYRRHCRQHKHRLRQKLQHRYKLRDQRPSALRGRYPKHFQTLLFREHLKTSGSDRPPPCCHEPLRRAKFGIRCQIGVVMNVAAMSVVLMSAASPRATRRCHQPARAHRRLQSRSPRRQGLQLCCRVHPQHCSWRQRRRRGPSSRRAYPPSRPATVPIHVGTNSAKVAGTNPRSAATTDAFQRGNSRSSVGQMLFRMIGCAASLGWSRSA